MAITAFPIPTQVLYQTSGSADPSASASAIGERYIRTDTDQEWVAKTVGNGAADWIEVTAGGLADGDTLSTGLTFPNTGLHILDTNASHDLILAPGSDLTADRTLTITTGDADRALTLNASSTLNGDYTSLSGLNTALGGTTLFELPAGAANQLLTNDGDGTITSENNMIFTGSQFGIGVSPAHFIQYRDSAWTTGSTTTEWSLEDSTGNKVFELNQFGKAIWRGKGASANMDFYSSTGFVYCSFDTSGGGARFQFADQSGVIRLIETADTTKGAIELKNITPTTTIFLTAETSATSYFGTNQRLAVGKTSANTKQFEVAGQAEVSGTTFPQFVSRYDADRFNNVQSNGMQVNAAAAQNNYCLIEMVGGAAHPNRQAGSITFRTNGADRGYALDTGALEWLFPIRIGTQHTPTNNTYTLTLGDNTAAAASGAASNAAVLYAQDDGGTTRMKLSNEGNADAGFIVTSDKTTTAGTTPAGTIRVSIGGVTYNLLHT